MNQILSQNQQKVLNFFITNPTLEINQKKLLEKIKIAKTTAVKDLKKFNSRKKRFTYRFYLFSILIIYLLQKL